MPVRHHHQVTVVIWKRVQHQKGPLPAFQDPACLFRLLPRHPVLNRIIGRRQQIAEDASVIAGPRRQGFRYTPPSALGLICHVRIAPRCPQVIHPQKYRWSASETVSGCSLSSWFHRGIHHFFPPTIFDPTDLRCYTRYCAAACGIQSQTVVLIHSRRNLREVSFPPAATTATPRCPRKKMQLEAATRRIEQ